MKPAWAHHVRGHSIINMFCNNSLGTRRQVRNTFRFYVYQSIYTGWWFPSRWKKGKSMGRIIQCMKWKIKHVPNHQPIYKCSPQYVKAAPCRTDRRFPALRMGSNINTKTWDTGNRTHMLHVWYIYLHLGDFLGKWSIWDKIPGSSNFPKGKRWEFWQNICRFDGKEPCSQT